jgi:putative chitinase
MMNIYIHHQTIDSCLKNNLDEKGNLSLFNFLDSICKELNKALGGINTLEPIIDEEENTIRIIDQSYYEPKPRKYELELYGYNHDFKSSNFVRNFNLKTEITPDFANMAAISSTAGGYVKGVENTMFSKWNKGLNDRLQPEISAPLSTGFSNSRDEVKETYLKKFWWGHKSAFGLKNTPEIELDPQIIENNVSIVSEFYKSIQSEIQLNVDEKYASPTNGFVPINLGVTMDGIGGIKIYNELSVASRFLPPRYPENLHFIIRGVHHKLSNSDWETSVETTSIANSDNNGSHYIQYDKLFAEVKKILGETNEQIPGHGKMKKGNPPQHLTQVINSFGITDNLERAHFLAQTAYESGNYTRTSENLRYTTKKQLQAIFGNRIPPNELDSYLNNPEKLGNKVYANRNGNGDVASGDGYKYRGRGYIQLTGKNNYIAFNKYLKQKGIQDDVIKNPDLVATKYPSEASVFYWTSPSLGGSKNISKVAKKGSTPQDVLNVTKIVAGATPDPSNVSGKIEYFNYFYQTNTPNSPDLQSGLTLF